MQQRPALDPAQASCPPKAIRCAGIQSKDTGAVADEFAVLTVDADGNRRRRIITPGDGERVRRQPQIE
jgi:hypothetical protein